MKPVAVELSVFEWSWRLWLVEGLKSLSDGDGYSGIVVDPSNFRFSRRGYHVSDFLAFEKYIDV